MNRDKFHPRLVKNLMTGKEKNERINREDNWKTEI
jgi:hypothetical protein